MRISLRRIIGRWKRRKEDNFIINTEEVTLMDFRRFLNHYGFSEPYKDIYPGKMEVENNEVIMDLRYLKRKSEVLDVGVGDSLLPCFLSKLGYQVTVIDWWKKTNKPSVVGSKKYHRKVMRITNTEYTLIRADIITYDFKGKRFDLIVALSSIEHFAKGEISESSFKEDKSDTLAVEKLSALLKYGGKLIITVPVSEKGQNDSIAREHNRDFFERWYTEKDKMERIIIPAKLRLIKNLGMVIVLGKL